MGPHIQWRGVGGATSCRPRVSDEVADVLVGGGVWLERQKGIAVVVKHTRHDCDVSIIHGPLVSEFSVEKLIHLDTELYHEVFGAACAQDIIHLDVCFVF